MDTNSSIDFDRIKQAASGQWDKIIPALTQLPAEVLTRGSTDHPCPYCSGQSVIWPARDADSTGSIACRKCTNNELTGDGIGTVAKFAGLSQLDAAKSIADYIGIDGASKSVPVARDIIHEVCIAKRMPLEAFMQFEPVATTRGRERDSVARVPVYDERGEKHSHFDLVPQGKGFFARGAGMSGMFFPGRLPQRGETWLVVEGCKDAAALVGLGFSAAGLPTSYMADKYARLFAGVHVVLVPDLDKAGQLGAQKSGGHLAGIAASVKIARLPGEIVESSGDDVRDVLGRQDGERLVRQAIELAEQWLPRDGDVNPKDGRPEVLVTLAYGHVADQVAKHLGKLGWESPWIPPHKREALKIYQRGGSLVQVVASDDDQQLQGVGIPAGMARIRPLPIGQLPLRIADSCQLLQEVEKDGEIERVAVPPGRWLIDGIFSKGDWGSDVRRLAGVVCAPTLRPDGTILQAAGYDNKTGLIYQPGATKFPTVPDKPTIDDARQAASELLEVVKDFPYCSDSDKSAWLAMVLTMIGRPAIVGCVPLFALTSTCRGSGKSLQADAASLIAYGRHAPRKTFSGDDDETRKAITATAIEALPSVLLDNVDCVLGGASLDAALTATIWNDRVLGSNRTTGDLPLRTNWMATGNNLRFGSDLARRVLPIRLAPQDENPEERTDFQHVDLLGWVAENRARLAVAALTILRAYFVAGRPVQDGGTWGSFENWSAIVRGAIVWAECPDPLATRETAKADDTSGAIVRGLVGGLLEVDETGDGLTAREIIDRLNDPDPKVQASYNTMREVVGEVATFKGKLNQRSLGNVFRKYRGRVANNFRIDGEPSRTGVIKWRAVQISAGYAGYAGYAPSASACKNSVSHMTHTHTHTFTTGDSGETYPANPAHPADSITVVGEPCVDCGSCSFTLGPEIDGWVNWDCVRCGRSNPRRIVSQVK